MPWSKAAAPKTIARSGTETNSTALRDTWLQSPFLRLIVLAFIFVFFVPTAFFVLPDFGTEPSWKLMLNKAFSDGWAFGDRVIWTYGPLGFLESRYPFGVSLYCYAMFDLLVLLLFVMLVLDVSRLKFDQLLGWACFASLFTCKRLIHDQPSAALFVLVIFLIVRNLTQPGLVTSAALVAGSVVAFFFKLNFGLAVLCLCGGVCLLQTMSRDKSARIWWLVVLLQLGLAWALARQFQTNPGAYVRGTLAVIRQYSDGGAWGPGPGAVAYRVVCICFWAFVGLAIAFIRKPGFSKDGLRTGLYLSIGSASTFILYKASIVRGDYNHTKIFLLGFPILAVAFLVHAPESLKRLWRFFFLYSTAYTTMLMLAEFGNALIYMQPTYLQAFFPVDYFRGIRDYRLVRDWGAYTSAVRYNCPERAIPDAVRQLIGTNRVDVFPSESTLALGSGLNYYPRPIPQSYVSMDPELEARDVSFLESEQSPKFIFQVLGEKSASPDGRYTLWDEPTLQRVMRREYAPWIIFTNLQSAAPELPAKMSPILVLQRRLTAAKIETATLAVNREQAGREFTVPEQEGELFARIRIKKTLLGRVVSFFYRGAPVYARFRLEGGATKELRAIPSNLESGVLVNFFADVNNPESTKNFLYRNSVGNPKCVALQFTFDHSWEYRQEFEVAYFREQAVGQ
jgi:hypothetical protein